MVEQSQYVNVKKTPRVKTLCETMTWNDANEYIFKHPWYRMPTTHEADGIIYTGHLGYWVSDEIEEQFEPGVSDHHYTVTAPNEYHITNEQFKQDVILIRIGLL